MIIAIDASRATRPKPTGTELYSARIIEYLATIDHANSYWLYSPTEPPSDFPKLPENFRWKIIPFPRLWSQIRLSLALLLDKPDVLFVPAHVIPLLAPKNTVVTIHDIAFDIFPEAYSRFNRWYQHYALRQALKRSRAIITPSQSARDDLVKFYRADATKIYPIHLGIDKNLIGQKVTIPDKIKALKPFFLMVGRLETKKNTARVIEAFEQFRSANPKDKAKLVLIGKPGYGYEAVEEAIQALPDQLRHEVIVVGYANDDDLRAYFAAANALIYASLYEGFGLPLLEAMAFEVPIITSDTSSMPEVVDDAAILVDPQSTDEIAKAMAMFISTTIAGDEVVKRERERIKLFSWEKTATETLKVLEGALK